MVVRGVAATTARRLMSGKPEPPLLDTTEEPPGRMHQGRYIRGPSHGPPRQAWGDPPGIPVDWGGCSLDTYGRWSGPTSHAGTSRHGDPPLFETTTGPPGRLSHGRFIRGPSHGPPRQARGDPPGIPIVWGGCDPPRARAGPFTANRRGPPGSFATHSSLSAERRWGPILAPRPETVRPVSYTHLTLPTNREV